MMGKGTKNSLLKTFPKKSVPTPAAIANSMARVQTIINTAKTENQG